MNSQTHPQQADQKLNDPGTLPVFFIVGRGRSGSTLLRFIFDAHPHVMIPLESRFVQFLYYKYASITEWTVETAEQAIHDLGHAFEPPELRMENLKKQISVHASDLSFGFLCKLIYLNTRTEFPKKKIHAIGDKNPRYTFFIPQLLKIFPDARFIHLVRDYRDNVAAIQRAAGIIHESGHVCFSLGRWKLYNRVILKYQKKYPDKFCTVRFEDLITHPEKAMEKLCGFLALDFYPEILNYHNNIHKYYRNADFNSLHQSLKLNFDPAKAGEWKTILSREKAIRCEVLAGSFPERYGYLPQLNVNSMRKTWIKMIFLPVSLLGQIRYALKILFYRSPAVMRTAYRLLLKIK